MQGSNKAAFVVKKIVDMDYSRWKSTQKQSGCKKRCSPVQNGQCEKICEIKGGDQEMAVMV